MPDGSKLKDPCEAEDVDVTSNLTEQQRESLATSAQMLLRRIHFRQMHKVLHMDLLPSYEERKAQKKKEQEEKKKLKEQNLESNGTTKADESEATKENVTEEAVSA